MREEGVVIDYAIGGATAVLFYAEPTRTYDVDVFALLPADESSSLAPLVPVYQWARAHGFTVDAGHILVHGVPVQVLPAYSALVVEAIQTARVHYYEDVSVRVVGPEHLAALALQAGGARRRERAWLLLQTARIDRDQLRALVRRHDIDVEIPDEA